MRAVTSVTGQHSETHWILILIIELALPRTRYYIVRLLRHLSDRLTFTTKPRRHIVFKVRTNHDSLKRILNLTNIAGRLARWRIRLSKSHFDVIHLVRTENQAADALYRLRTHAAHRIGTNHQSADALLCLRTLREDKKLLKDNLPILAVDASNDNDSNAHIIYTPGKHIIQLSVKVALSVTSRPTENDFIVERASDSYCREVSEQYSHPNSEFQWNQSGFLLRYSTINNATQIVAPASPRKHVLHLPHHSLIARLTGQCRMYDTFRFKSFLAHMASEVWETVAECVSGTQKGKKLWTQKTSSTLSCRRTPWLLCHEYYRTAAKKDAIKPVCFRRHRQVL